MKKLFCIALFVLSLFSISFAETAMEDYESILTGSWSTMVSEWNLNELPGSFSYPSESVLLTYSPNGTCYLNFYRETEEGEHNRNEPVSACEVRFAVNGESITLSNAYNVIVYEKIETGSLVGGNWYADYFIDDYRPEPYNPGHQNLYGIRLSFNHDGTDSLILITRNPRYEFYNEEESSATWILEDNMLTVSTEAEGFETMKGSFDGSSINFSISIPNLLLRRN